MTIEYTLTRRKWRDFKKEHGLSKSPMFKKADVGPSIIRLHKAALAYERDKGEKALLKVFSAATRLQKSFAKFVKVKKDIGELSKAANKQIDDWNNELGGIIGFLAQVSKKSPDKLKQKDRENLEDTIDTFIL